MYLAHKGGIVRHSQKIRGYTLGAQGSAAPAWVGQEWVALELAQALLVQVSLVQEQAAGSVADATQTQLH